MVIGYAPVVVVPKSGAIQPFVVLMFAVGNAETAAPAETEEGATYSPLPLKTLAAFTPSAAASFA